MDPGELQRVDVPSPQPSPDPPVVLELPDRLLTTVLSALAAADDSAEVAAAVLAVLSGLTEVRAVAVVTRAGREVVVLGSAGYPCGTFAAGAALPLDGGLPVTEAVRTGRPVLQGVGPGWVAVPLPGRGHAAGALLLSLHSPPPDGPGLVALTRIAAAVASALERAERSTAAARDLGLLTTGLLPGELPVLPGVELAVHARPHSGVLAGDAVAAVAEPDGGWLLLADVSGRGAAAAPTAAALRAALSAVATLCRDPRDVLRALDRAVQRGPEGFATALVLRVRGTEVDMASAGHALPLLVDADGRVEQLVGAVGLPLGCGLGPQDAALLTVRPGAGLVVAWTDGLVDRTGEVDLAPLLAPWGGRSAAAAAAALVRGCDLDGPSQDDVSLVVLRTRQGDEGAVSPPGRTPPRP